MKIRKAKEEDWNGYYKLKIEESKEYDKIIGEKIEMPSKQKLRKEFKKFVNGKNLLIFVIEIDKKVVAYINCKIHKSFWVARGYVDDLFVLKNHRRAGLATKLINEFVEVLRKKKIKELELSVALKNDWAISLYNKLGFKIVKYIMRKN